MKGTSVVLILSSLLFIYFTGYLLLFTIRRFFHENLFRESFLRDFLSNKCFYAFEMIFFCRITKSNRCSLSFRTPCTPNSVYIILYDDRDIKVDYMAHFAHVQAPGGYIGSYQYAQVSFLKSFYRINPRILSFISMNYTHVLFSIFFYQVLIYQIS